MPHAVKEKGPGAASAFPLAPRGFARFAWAVLAYNLAVILWGALVRATGSGAGCGGHWPLCNGEVLPAALPSATLIELTHRVMSGVALVAVIALFVWASKGFSRIRSQHFHPARRWAAWALVFMCTEALLGASLVLLGHVAANESVGRVYSLCAHLLNTFLLLAALTLTARWASLPAPNLSPPEPHTRGPLAIAFIAVVVVAMAGAITALGDTLFPTHSLAQGVADDFSSTAHFLIRLRILHPALAVFAGLYLAMLAAPHFIARQSARLRTLSGLLLGLVALQILAGAANILLRAPLPMQLIHLLIADALWIALVLFSSERLAAPALPASPSLS